MIGDRVNVTSILDLSSISYLSLVLFLPRNHVLLAFVVGGCSLFSFFFCLASAVLLGPVWVLLLIPFGISAPLMIEFIWALCSSLISFISYCAYLCPLEGGNAVA